MSSKKSLDILSWELVKEAFNKTNEKASILSMEVNFTFVGIKQRNASAGVGYLPLSYPYSNCPSAMIADESLPAPSRQIIPTKNKITVTLPVIFYIGN